MALLTVAGFGFQTRMLQLLMNKGSVSMVMVHVSSTNQPIEKHAMITEMKRYKTPTIRHQVQWFHWYSHHVRSR